MSSAPRTTFSPSRYTRRTLLRGAGAAAVAGASLTFPLLARADDSVGPLDDELRFDASATFFQKRRYFLDATDVVMNATFRNPYDASKGIFSYGFRFRMVGDRGTGIYITSDGFWVRLAFDSDGKAVNDKRLIGSVANVRGGENDTNDMQVIVVGDVAELLVNGVSAASIRLDEVVSGNVEVTTNNVISKADAKNAVTRYTGFYAAPPPAPSVNAQRARAYLYGPATGGIRHNPANDLIERVGTNLTLRDCILNGRFFVPFNDPNIGWDTGFEFRFTETQELRLVLAASRQYYITVGNRPDNKAEWKYRDVQSGALSGLRTGVGDFNDMEIVLNGPSGTLAVNGVGISERLDLSGASEPGLVYITAGSRRNSEKAGAVQRYENFTIAPLPPR